MFLKTLQNIQEGLTLKLGKQTLYSLASYVLNMVCMWGKTMSLGNRNYWKRMSRQRGAVCSEQTWGMGL